MSGDEEMGEQEDFEGSFDEVLLTPCCRYLLHEGFTVCTEQDQLTCVRHKVKYVRLSQLCTYPGEPCMTCMGTLSTLQITLHTG